MILYDSNIDNDNVDNNVMYRMQPGPGQTDYTPEHARVKFHWKVPVNVRWEVPVDVHWRFPVKVHWTSDNPPENTLDK